ncbi:MAG TPA: IS1182 family transposase, partial [Sphingomicrobium sp.]|nr:IS1182 family transposase [Sphingomicrobium sp.]
MMAHVEGESRLQGTLFPPSLDELVGANHPVRVIDAFVDTLDLAALGFAKVVAEATGRPPYRPGDLLKLYVYGYLDQVRSSRRLEKEAGRNLEVMWLINRLAPSFKTIADFRKDHPRAIVDVCRAFVQFCRTQSLFGAEVLAIDGSKIEAVASRKQVVTPKSAAKQLAALDRKIAAYLAAMDEADREEPSPAPADVAAALQVLRERREAVRREAEELAAKGLAQRVRTEPEARLMRTARHGHQVAYNVQTAVDAKHGLIAAFDLTNEGNDERQLHPMAERGRAALEVETVTAVADTGYSSGEQGRRCEEAGITAIVPRADTVNPAGAQYFPRTAFRYDAASDSWQCPAGETLVRRQVSQSERKWKYWTTACSGCALKAQCTKAEKRMIVRHFDEEAREAMHRRATSDPRWMKLRRELVEHPFGTLKWLMGMPRFLVRGLEKAT